MRGHFVFIFVIDLSFSSFIGLCVCSFTMFYRNKINTFEFFMPRILPDAIDNHACMKIFIQDNFYLVGFEPQASMHIVHQMLLFGCSEPAANETVWSCMAGPCRNGTQVIYGWGRDAPSYFLPRRVAFRIGPDTPVKHLVLQVHYLQRYKEDNTLAEIECGVILSYTRRRMPRQAGVILLGSYGVIPAHSVERFESACAITENKTIHPFAFRAHTHKFGEVVSCYVVRQGAAGDAWTALAKGRAARAEAFRPVRATARPLRAGDVLATRCTINNTGPHSLRLQPGPTENNEICNLYLMYWTEESPLEQNYCMSPGPPAYYWSHDMLHFRNIPHLQASIL